VGYVKQVNFEPFCARQHSTAKRLNLFTAGAYIDAADDGVQNAHRGIHVVQGRGLRALRVQVDRVLVCGAREVVGNDAIMTAALHPGR
jgi:hypothetical protein